MKRVLLVTLCVLFISGTVSADTFGMKNNKFTIDFVTISGDTNPTSGYGIVNGDYRIGMLEISNDQFTKFASNNPHWTDAGVPASMVSWFEAAQFVNYLNTSTGHQVAYKFNEGEFDLWSVGDDGYSVNNRYRNTNAKYFLPTEDEWVKAAYWNGTSMQTYATTDGLTPIAGVDTNYGQDSPYDGPWDVGSGAEELNGTKNMMGNVTEWMESPRSRGDFRIGANRAIRGGSYGHTVDDIHLYSYRYPWGGPLDEYHGVGFRVASVVPEPCSLVLLSLGGLMMRRRRKA